MKIFLLLATTLVLCACVNVHVHFPSAPPEEGAAAAKTP